MISAIFFDLDGTLADTAYDLGNALNQLRRNAHLSDLPYETIRPIAGLGARGLLKLGFNMDENHADYFSMRENYLTAYDACFDQNPLLFDGIVDVLNQIQKKSLIWGVITNKPQRFTDRLLPLLPFPTKPHIVVSGDTLSQSKPSPEPLLYAASECRVLPSDCWYIGDSYTDIQAACAAGMKSGAALWGYIPENEQPQQWQADALFSNPQDLLPIIQQAG
ncbi:MAG: HAD family hydrolase [Neisseriaceae bacterium]|nr:HAD family hydrolase [Neisseriaceae bacterium]